MRDEFGIEDFLGVLHEYTLRQFCRDAGALGGGIVGDLSIARGGIVGDLSIALIAPLRLHICCGAAAVLWRCGDGHAYARSWPISEAGARSC